MEAVEKCVVCLSAPVAQVRGCCASKQLGGSSITAAAVGRCGASARLSYGRGNSGYGARFQRSSACREGALNICAASFSRNRLQADRSSIFTSRLLRSASAASKLPTGKANKVHLAVRAGSDRPSYVERILSSVAYFLPLLDGLQYGRHFFRQFPAAEAIFYPLFPLFQAYKSIPYSNLIVFFTLYLGVVRNERMSRYVRFNAMQAVVLDVLLILPQVIERIVSPRGGLALQILVMLYNSLFLFLVASFCFGVISCLLGKTPRLPLVADAADAQV